MPTQDQLTKDWNEATEMVLICRRPDDTIAVHKWCSDDAACRLAMQAFAYNIKPLFNTDKPVAIYDAKKQLEAKQ